MAIVYRVYGNDGAGGPIDYTTPLATTSSTTIDSDDLDSPLVVGASKHYRFGVRAYDNVSGHEEQNIDAVVEIVTDSGGNDITNVPDQPQHVRAIAGSNGFIYVHWYYPYPLTLKTPTQFNVYMGSVGGGSVNYSTAVATTAYTTGGAFYSVTLADIPAGLYCFGVRAENASGEETNTNYVTATSVTSAPSSVVSLAGVATA